MALQSFSVDEAINLLMLGDPDDKVNVSEDEVDGDL